MKMAGLNHKTIVCNGSMVDLTYLDRSSLVINKTLTEERHGSVTVYCKYRNIWRKDNEDNSLEFSEFSSSFTDSFKLPADAEFILVVCEGCPEHEKLEKNGIITAEQKKRRVITFKETMNIIMIGLDGVPRHQFLRAMNRTYGLLMKDFNSFDMSMYTQPGYREGWRYHQSRKHCVGNRPEVSFHFDYILRYLETFPDKPLYAMSFSTKITHDDMTNMVDDPCSTSTRRSTPPAT
ncbi:hypothetical protein Btru_050490 [Bulinus truncatus]|nr:hypothetical protein Btru_050490 [Bulinus truncatus]